MNNISDIITSISSILWPLIFLIFLFIFRKYISSMFESGSELGFEFMGNKFTIKPTQRIRPPLGQIDESHNELGPIDTKKSFPHDYLFLVHTSFLRDNLQKEFQQKTKVPLPHYDIRVKLDSYYRGALDKVEKVEYYLHESYPNPIQVKLNRNEKFLLKELANGEYVLLAKVFLIDEKKPIVLQRYINLWKDGARI